MENCVENVGKWDRWSAIFGGPIKGFYSGGGGWEKNRGPENKKIPPYKKGGDLKKIASYEIRIRLNYTRPFNHSMMMKMPKATSNNIGITSFQMRSVFHLRLLLLRSWS